MNSRPGNALAIVKNHGKSIGYTLLYSCKFLLKNCPLHLILLVVVSVFLIQFVNDTELKTWTVLGFYIIIILPAFLFLIHACQDFFKYQNKTGLVKDGTKYYPHDQHYTGLTSLLLFYSGLVIFLVLFVPKPPITLIPDMNPGSNIGLRAWSCKATVDSMSVYYEDSDSVWKEIPQEILFDPCNWSGPHWYNNKNQDTTGRDVCKVTWGGGKRQVTINRCGMVFTPKDTSLNLEMKNVVMFARIRFENFADDDFFPGFQFCFCVNDKKIKEGKDSTYSEMYLAFDYGLFNDAKPWIPLLNLYPTVTRPDGPRKLAGYGYRTDHNPDHPDYQCKLTAFKVDDQVRMLFHSTTKKKGALTLFEAKINANGK